MSDLTPKQLEVLAFIRRFMESGGLPLISFLQNDSGAASGWSPGEVVAVNFEPDSVVVLEGRRAS